MFISPNKMTYLLCFILSSVCIINIIIILFLLFIMTSMLMYVIHVWQLSFKFVNLCLDFFSQRFFAQVWIDETLYCYVCFACVFFIFMLNDDDNSVVFNLKDDGIICSSTFNVLCTKLFFRQKMFSFILLYLLPPMSLSRFKKRVSTNIHLCI